MLSEYDRGWCNKLLTDLTKWAITSPFRMPVDPIRDGCPNYHLIVASPMDFHTMKKKLTASEYSSVEQFIDDIQLICDNAKKFNGASSMYGLICDDIMAEVHRQYSEKPNSADDEWYKSLLKAVRALDDHLADAPAEVSLSREVARPPKVTDLTPAQRDAIQRQMGSEKIENLPRRWVVLNDATRAKILAVVGQTKK
jgi:hypothetical protein